MFEELNKVDHNVPGTMEVIELLNGVQDKNEQAKVDYEKDA